MLSRQPPPVASDTLCESCGYLLNGLPDSGNCPECGTPVSHSTAALHRHPPAWESGSRSRFFSTFSAVITRRRAFFQNLSLHADTRRSRYFALICLSLSAWMNLKTIAAHYLVLELLSVAPTWASLLFMLLALLLFAILAAWWALLELVVYLTALEGAFWGLRLPRPIVRRVLHYWTAQIAVASLVLAIIPVGYLLLIVARPDMGLYMSTYLYTLSGAVVVVAIYLFQTYFGAIKAIVHANPATPGRSTVTG